VGAVPITPKLYGRPTNRKNGLSAEFTKLLDAANITRVFTDADTGARRVADVGFHALRHTAASNLADAGVPEDVRLAHLGQSSRVNKDYTHRKADAMRAALNPKPAAVAV
jgi:integrase